MDISGDGSQSFWGDSNRFRNEYFGHYSLNATTLTHRDLQSTKFSYATGNSSASKSASAIIAGGDQ